MIERVNIATTLANRPAVGFPDHSLNAASLPSGEMLRARRAAARNPLSGMGP